MKRFFCVRLIQLYPGQQMSDYSKFKISTRTLHEDANIHPTKGTVNPPVFHASTILFDTLEQIEDRTKAASLPGHSTYGIHGTSVHYALAQTITNLENGHDTIITSSGLMAITLAIGAVLNSGDHLLMTDSVYGPTRSFCDHVLSRQNIEVTYYSPRIGGDIKSLIKPNTRAIFLESPGSYTFEVQDVPAIVAVAKAYEITTLIDNSWATPLFFQPLCHDVDISIHAATKYFGGHSDVMGGSITANEKTYPRIHQYAQLMGNHIGPDDCYLILRGLRSLEPKLKHHEKSGLEMAKWLSEQPEVKYVIHPAREDHPDHHLWKRDFKGASSLFGFVLNPVDKPALAAMLDNLELFGMGYSWGGYESMLVPGFMSKIRTAEPWQEEGIIMRIHIGLEDLGDLKNDLREGFDRMNNAKV